MSDRRAASLLLLLSLVAQVPFLTLGASPLDEGSILEIGSSLARGETLYLDRVTIVGPLLYELLAALLRAAGDHLLVARVLQACLFSIVTLLSYGLARSLAGVWQAFGVGIGVIALKPIAYPLWTILSYSHLAMVLLLGCLLAACAALGSERRARLMVAGSIAGLCFLAQQSLGGVAALSLASVFLVRRLRTPPFSLRSTGGDAAWLLVASLLPVLAFGAYYASQGALWEAARLTLVQSLGSHGSWWIPPPSPGVWPSDQLAHRILTYTPSGISDLVMQGKLRPQPTTAIRLLEGAAKAVYFLPWLALLGSLVVLLRGSDRGGETWLRRFLLTVSAGLAYASVVRRADWTHLATVYPLVLVAIGTLPGWGRRVWAVFLAGWLLLAVVTSVSIHRADRIAVQTSRGSFRAVVPKGDHIQRALEWLNARPDAERIAFLPAQPLLHFLSGRGMPLCCDLILPILVGPREDRRLAREVLELDQVVLDPTPLASVEGSLPELAPRFSRAVAENFEPSALISPTALVLSRREGEHAGEVVVDLFERANPDQRRRWMVYRVVAPASDPRSAEPACVELPVGPGRGEHLEFSPMFDPRIWAPGYRGRWFPHPTPVEVWAEVRDASGEVHELYRDRMAAGIPPSRVSLPLADTDAERVLSLCAAPSGDDEPVYLPVGLAEPRIVRRAQR